MEAISEEFFDLQTERSKSQSIQKSQVDKQSELAVFKLMLQREKEKTQKLEENLKSIEDKIKKSMEKSSEELEKEAVLQERMTTFHGIVKDAQA